MCTESSINKKRYPNPVPDVGVLYTGEDVPALGIVKDCSDLRLYDIEKIILDRLQAVATGSGITLSQITGNCDFVNTTLAASDKSLASLIQLLFNNDCSLRDYIDMVNNKIEPPFSFDLKCLTSVVPTTPNRNQIIQAILDQTCANTTDITQIKSELANDDTENSIMNAVKDVIGNMVSDMFTSCQNNLVKTGAGVNAKINIVGDCPIGTILYGVFDRSSFDDSGLGLASAGLCGWRLANGNGGTVDVRGFTLASTIDTQGPALNSLVAPGTDPDLIAAYLTKKGRNKYTLLSSQIPDHQHTTSVTQTPHTHNIQTKKGGNGGGGSNAALNSNFGDPYTITTDPTTVNLNVTVSGVTGTTGQPIDARQPTIYLRAIQRVA